MDVQFGYYFVMQPMHYDKKPENSALSGMHYKIMGRTTKICGTLQKLMAHYKKTAFFRAKMDD